MRRKLLLAISHLLFWGLATYVVSRIFGISTVEVFADSDGREEVIVRYDDHFIWATCVTVVLCALMFYCNIFLFLKTYFRDRKGLQYFLKLTGLLFICLGTDIFVNRYFNYRMTTDDGLFSFPSLGLHMLLFVFFTALSFAYAFTLEWYRNEKSRNEIAKENLRTELNFLKSQINPHFLFNTLNNLYSISQKHGIEQLSTGINELSNLMRYMLYESKGDFVSLKKEVQHIESFIEIQQLRHEEEDELLINFEKKGDLTTAVIPPMILLPFVENAFKHGFSLSEKSVIHLTLKVSDSRIYFKVMNKAFKLHKFSDKTSGIGLENVTRRLSLIYPNRHDLKTYEKEGYYTVKLKIPRNG